MVLIQMFTSFKQRSFAVLPLPPKGGSGKTAKLCSENTYFHFLFSLFKLGSTLYTQTRQSWQVVSSGCGNVKGMTSLIRKVQPRSPCRLLSARFRPIPICELEHRWSFNNLARKRSKYLTCPCCNKSQTHFSPESISFDGVLTSQKNHLAGQTSQTGCCCWYCSCVCISVTGDIARRFLVCGLVYFFFCISQREQKEHLLNFCSKENFERSALAFETAQVKTREAEASNAADKADILLQKFSTFEDGDRSFEERKRKEHICKYTCIF